MFTQLIAGFTFQYVSIKTLSSRRRRSSAPQFTFQYVSIKTIITDSEHLSHSRFTFQYVSIKTMSKQKRIKNVVHLHSNMFLLRRGWYSLPSR